MVDDLSIKYGTCDDIDHLLGVLKQHYHIEIDWKGELYCGIMLDWNYEQRMWICLCLIMSRRYWNDLATMPHDKNKIVPTNRPPPTVRPLVPNPTSRRSRYAPRR